MDTNQLIIIILFIALIIYAISRQVLERRVKKFAFTILPAIILYLAYKSLPKSFIPKEQIIQCLVTVIIGLLAAAIMSSYTRVYYKGNELYMRGGKETLIAWVALLFLRIIVKVLFKGYSNASFQSTEWILFTGIAVTFGFRNILLYIRYPEVKKFFHERKENRLKKV